MLKNNKKWISDECVCKVEIYLFSDCFNDFHYDDQCKIRNEVKLLKNHPISIYRGIKKSSFPPHAINQVRNVVGDDDDRQELISSLSISISHSADNSPSININYTHNARN